MQVTRAYELKLKPNKSQQSQLDNYFYEAKCLYNYLLNCSNLDMTKDEFLTALDEKISK